MSSEPATFRGLQRALILATSLIPAALVAVFPDRSLAGILEMDCQRGYSHDFPGGGRALHDGACLLGFCGD